MRFRGSAQAMRTTIAFSKAFRVMMSRGFKPVLSISSTGARPLAILSLASLIASERCAEEAHAQRLDRARHRVHPVYMPPQEPVLELRS